MSAKSIDALFGRAEYVEARFGATHFMFSVRAKTPGVVTMTVASPHLRQEVGMSAEALRTLLTACTDLLKAPRPTGWLARRRPVVAASLTPLMPDLAVDLRRYGKPGAERVTSTFQSTSGPTFAAFDLPAADFEAFIEHASGAEALADASQAEHARSLLADVKESAAALRYFQRRYAAAQNN